MAQIEYHFGRTDNRKKALKEYAKLNKESAENFERNIKGRK
jgi:hypothetical protein